MLLSFFSIKVTSPFKILQLFLTCSGTITDIHRNINEFSLVLLCNSMRYLWVYFNHKKNRKQVSNGSEIIVSKAQYISAH